MTERAVQINGTRSGFNGSAPPKLRATDGRLIQFGANANPGDEQAWQGQPFDLKVFDEAVQRSEEHTSQLQSLMRSSYAVCCLKKNTPLQSLMTLTPPVASS